MSANTRQAQEATESKRITEHLAADVDNYVYYRCSVCSVESVDRGYVADCCECEI